MIVWVITWWITCFYKIYLQVPRNWLWQKGNYYRTCIPCLAMQHARVGKWVYDGLKWVYDGLKMLLTAPFMFVWGCVLLVLGIFGFAFVTVSEILAFTLAVIFYACGLLFGIGWGMSDTFEMLVPSHTIRNHFE